MHIIQQQEEVLVSNEMNDFIHTNPDWLTRRGNSLFLLSLLVLTGICWFIRYPEKINAPMLLITDGTKLRGEINSITNNSRKIKQGQRVIVQVSGFKSNEVGYLEGEIKYIFSVAKIDSSVQILINFPKGLTTSYGKRLVVKKNTAATAEIITTNSRLLIRMFRQLMELFEKD